MTQPVSPALQATIAEGQTDLSLSGQAPRPAAAVPDAINAYRLPSGEVEYMDSAGAALRRAVPALPEEIAQADQDRRLVQQVRAEGFSGSLKAAGEGFLGGLIPFGGADLARSGMTQEERDLARVRSLEHNWITGAGELVGMGVQQVGLNALLPGLGLATKGAAAAGAGTQALARPLLRRAAEHAATNAIRGAYTGAQLSFNEESRENLQHDAERIAHGALVGATIEALIGTPLGLLKDRKAARLLTEKLAEAPAGLEAAPDALVEHAAGVVAKAGRRNVEIPYVSMPGAPLSILEDIAPGPLVTPPGVPRGLAKKLAGLSAEGREYRILADSADEILQKSAIASTTAAEVGVDSVEKLLSQESNQAAFRLGALAAPEKRAEIIAFGEDVFDQLSKAYGFAGREFKEAKLVKRMDKFVPGFKKQIEEFYQSTVSQDVEQSAQAINKLRQGLGKANAELGRVIEGARAVPNVRAEAQIFKEKLEDIYANIANGQRNPEIFGEKYATAAGEAHDAISALVAREKALSAFGFFQKEGEHEFDSFLTKRGVNPNAVKAILERPEEASSIKQAELLFGLSGAAEGSAASKSYMQLVSDVADAIDRHFSSDLTRETRQNVTSANVVLEYSRGIVGQSQLAKSVLEKAARGGGLDISEGLLRPIAATLGATTFGPAGGFIGYAAAGGLGHLLNYGKRVKSLTSLENILDSLSKREQAGIKTFFSAKGADPVQPIITHANNGSISSALIKAAANPDQLASEIEEKTQALATYAPKLAKLASIKVQQIVNYIAQRLPAPIQTTNLLQAKAGETKPQNPSNVRSADRMVAAAIDPYTILTHPSPEGSQLVKDLYPNDFANMQMLLLEHAAGLKTQIPFSTRQTMFLLFDLPTDMLTDPKRYVELQEMLDKQQTKQAKARARPLDVASSYYTTTQKIEGAE